MAVGVAERTMSKIGCGLEGEERNRKETGINTWAKINFL